MTTPLRALALFASSLLSFACHKSDGTHAPPESAATTIVEGSNTSLVTAPPPSAAVKEVTRTLIAHDDIARQPGYETRLYLVEYPPGAEAKPHIHPTPGVGYVLEGSFQSSFDDGPVTVKQAGDSFVDLQNKVHHFRNPSQLQALKFLVSGTYKKGEDTFREATTP